ncbi:Ger(x)C family spore germination protein [Caldalkalibacillus mannanilyticus]|uniref:Ger(x)C family spore germination protein n=1 Tax=Caldalkalibacillus mannanilyticus TaxID=1418 RepID=UPI0009DE9048|nr:Ger(x)C family spore germination C-terminal domain-containing protein [Caldalkalibacillus mannanilyticus]
MFHSLETSSRKWAETDGVFLDELIHDILSEGKHPVITGIQIIGNPEEGKKEDNVKTSEAPVNFRYSGMGIFREDKLIGWLDEDESKAYNYIRNAVESTIINTNCSGDGYIGYDLIRASRKVKVIMKDSQPTIDLSFELEGDISDVECNQIDLADPQQIKQKEKEIATIVQEKIMRSIKNVQEEYQVDIFGFGDMIYRQKPQAWKKLKDDWDQHFVQLEVNVTVDAKIRRVGTIANTFKRK